MIVLPYGHDQSVYGRQWVTFGLIALSSAVFAITWTVEGHADAEIERRARAFTVLTLVHPEARIDASAAEGANDRLGELLAPLVQQDPEAPLTDADIELENATRDLIAAANELPTVRYGYRPGDPSPVTFLTSLFLHVGIWHLLGNMLFLWLAGAVIECFWDRLPYLGLYFASALGAIVAHHLAHPGSMTPVVGASGAIAGLLGAFVVGYPRTRIRVLWAMWPFGFGHAYVRAWLLIPAWALLQLAWALFDLDQGVAHWAHIGGFAVGAVGAVGMHRLGWVIEDAGDGTR